MKQRTPLVGNQPPCLNASRTASDQDSSSSIQSWRPPTHPRSRSCMLERALLSQHSGAGHAAIGASIRLVQSLTLPSSPLDRPRFGPALASIHKPSSHSQLIFFPSCPLLSLDTRAGEPGCVEGVCVLGNRRENRRLPAPCLFVCWLASWF